MTKIEDTAEWQQDMQRQIDELRKENERLVRKYGEKHYLKEIMEDFITMRSSVKGLKDTLKYYKDWNDAIYGAVRDATREWKRTH